MNTLPLKDAVQYLARLAERFRRFSSELRPPARQGVEYHIDDMILTNPWRALRYFRFEYSVSMAYSLVVLLVTIWFLAEERAKLQATKFVFFYYWLLVGTVLHPANALAKLLILMCLYNMPDTETLIVRRLMLLIRSNIFSWNERTSFVLYNFYALGMCKLASGNICGSLRDDVYRFCYFQCCSLLLRLANLFVRFFFEYCCFTRAVHFDTIISRGATAEEIAAIPVEDFRGEQSAAQWCGICLEHFQPGDKLRKLPCSRQHYFHKTCTDTWLRSQNVCPYCRKSLRKPRTAVRGEATHS